jgi:hypothetical protein
MTAGNDSEWGGQGTVAMNSRAFIKHFIERKQSSTYSKAHADDKITRGRHVGFEGTNCRTSIAEIAKTTAPQGFF